MTKRLLASALVLALAMFTVTSLVAADATDLSITITDYERNPARGSTFDVKFTVYVPSDITMPTTNCSLYYSTFYFVGDAIQYPAEGYWWGSYKGSVWYTPGQTNYTVKVKMLDDAPVGQEFQLGIYWKIPLAGSWEKSGDEVSFTLGGNFYTKPIVDTDTYPEYTRYTVSKISGGPIIYVRTDDPSLLYVRALKSDLTVSEAVGGGGVGGIPWAVVAGVVVVVVVVIAIAAAVALKRARPKTAPAPPAPVPPAAPAQ